MIVARSFSKMVGRGDFPKNLDELLLTSAED
jgi:hypothetical protein